MNASWARVHLPEVVIAARMEEKPDLLYDLSGRQGLLKQLILCGQRPCAERLAQTSSLWMLAYKLMTLTAALHVLQVKEEAVEGKIGPAVTLAALKEPLYMLAPYHRHYVHREFRAMNMYTPQKEPAAPQEEPAAPQEGQEGHSTKPLRPLQYYLLKRPAGMSYSKAKRKWKAMSRVDKTHFGVDTLEERKARN